MQLIDGRLLALEIIDEAKKTISTLHRSPRLAVILIGDDPASHLYVSLKEKAALGVGIVFEKILLPADVESDAVLEKIAELNGRQDVDAILVQLPLPAPLDAETVISAIDPEKDADGFHPTNLDAIRRGESKIFPGVTEGILRLIDKTGHDLSGRQACILANSDVFAYPLAEALGSRGMRVEVLMPPFDHAALIQTARTCTLIISAIGAPSTVTGEMVTDGAIIVDVGTTRLPDGKVVGDVAGDDFKDRDVWITPVPGGVGPVTVAMLLRRTTDLAKKEE